MKNLRVHIGLAIAAVALLLAVGSLTARISRGQSRVKRTVLKSDRPSTKKNARSVFAAAAGRNVALKNDLVWTFGKKEQHGWYLYDSLIRRTLNTKKDSSTNEFAAAVSLWQKNHGLNPVGVLDEETLMALVADWQNNRLKDRTPAAADQLMTAPLSDFYDPERLVELRQLERRTYAAYKKMVKAAIADKSLRLGHTKSGELSPAEKYFKIISSFRSREYQEKLRRESPNAGSAGLAVNSPHFTGRALDIYVGGDPVDTRDSNRLIQVNTQVYQWLVRNAARFGFQPYFYEPWHWEYVR